MEFLLIAFLVFIATMVQTSIGFGSAILFIPIATLFIGVTSSAAIMFVVVPLTATIMYPLAAERTPIKDSLLPAVVSLITFPLGILILINIDESFLRMCVGIAVLTAVVINYSTKGLQQSHNEPDILRIILAGSLSGLMRGALGMGGAPAVLYFNWLGGTANEYRSRLYGFTMTAGFIGPIIGALGGIYNQNNTLTLVMLALPMTIVGIITGKYISPRLSHKTVQKLSAGLLMIMSVIAIYTASSSLL
ncbi:MAG: TSUP family transporter [Dehalococcoidia bacterium]